MRGTWCSPRWSPGCCWRRPVRRRSWRAPSLAAALAGRSGVALLAAAAVLGGAALADARLAALDAGRLASMHGEPRRIARGPARAAARPWRRPLRRARPPARRPGRARAGRPAGARRGRRRAAATRRRRARAAAAGAARRGARRSATSCSSPGGWRRSGVYDAYQRRRNAHAAIDASRVVGDRRATRRARWARSTRCAGAARQGSSGGSRAPEAALLRGMVLGEDERLTEEVRDEFQRSGLAHILAVSGAERDAARRRWSSGACALFGVPLRARLVLAGGADRDLRAARRRWAVDPARRSDGRRRARRRARRAARTAVVRAPARRGRDARAQPACRR